MDVIVIPREDVRCADGRIEIDRSRWHTEAFAGTALRESGTFTLVAGSGGSLVLRYKSSRKGVLLYGIPVWVGDEDLYRFAPSAGEPRRLRYPPRRPAPRSRETRRVRVISENPPGLR